MRRVARAVLTLLMAGSLALTVAAGLRVATSPELSPLRERTAAEIIAVTDAMMARAATVERLSGLIRTRLDETPRNWGALQALKGEADKRGLHLPPDLLARYDAALADDRSLTRLAGDCAACIWDITACSLSNALTCKAPVMLTPIDDIRGLAKAGWDYISDGDVDEFDLGLSAVGLGATALVIASGGSSATVKLGAGVVKLARGMDVLSPRLVAMTTDAVKGRAGAFTALETVASDLGRLHAAVGEGATLHLLRYVDDGADARRMSRAAEALGPRTVARAEVLGPTRLMRATVRFSGTAWQMLAGLICLIGSVAALLGGMVQGAALRALRRAAR